MAPRDQLHPELAAFVDRLAVTTMDDERVAMIRANPLPLPEGPAGVVRRDHVVPGDPPVPVRVHRPEGATTGLGCLVSIHGGGMVTGSRDMDDVRYGGLCAQLEVAVVSVEYRLAPEWPYPAALEDCYRAVRWTFDHAGELSIDPTRIGVGGGSAGAGLAAAVALLARDRGEVALAFQLLECPMIDDRQITHSSQVDGLPVWSRESNAYGWRSYLGDLYGTPDVPPTAAPARATDLTGLPPALVNVGAVDGFLDEDVDYAQRLIQAGVACQLHVYPGACHGYQLAAGSEVAQRSARHVTEWLAQQLRA